jgi:hypothetical protein
MKLIKSAGGKRALRLSKAEWAAIGKTAGWEDMLPSERAAWRGTSSEMDARQVGETTGPREEDPEEKALGMFGKSDDERVAELKDKISKKAEPRLRTIIGEVAAGGINRQEAFELAANALREVFYQNDIDPKENALGRLRQFVSKPDLHPGFTTLQALVRNIAEQLGASIDMPSPEEFKKKEAAVESKIRITHEAWTKIGKRTGWMGTDKMKSEQVEKTGKLVVQVPGGEESEVEFEYTLTLKPKTKTNLPERWSTYKIVSSKPKLDEKGKAYAAEQVEKWMRENGAENVKPAEDAKS